MTTKAERKRKKRGRPREEGVDREDNGRKRRSRRPRERMEAVAIEARKRVYGLTEYQAGHQDAGTVRGRLYLRGIISRLQCDAADRYAERYQNARKAVEAPPCMEVTTPRGKADWDARDFDREAYEERATRAIADYEILRAALEDINAVHTVELVTVWDTEPTEIMLPALHEGLDLLVKRLRLGA